jgi:receptor expression-enhancing protein 5/6
MLFVEKFKELEEKTGYSKVYFFAATVSLSTLLIFVAGGMKLVSNLVGFFYPAYMSFKALEGGKSIDGDATQWMTYWIIFCSLNLMEETFPFITRVVSFYYVIKVLAVIYLYHPKTTGAQVIYNAGLRPYLAPMMEVEPKKTE